MHKLTITNVSVNKMKKLYPVECIVTSKLQIKDKLKKELGCLV